MENFLSADFCFPLVRRGALPEIACFFFRRRRAKTNLFFWKKINQKFACFCRKIKLSFWFLNGVQYFPLKFAFFNFFTIVFWFVLQKRWFLIPNLNFANLAEKSWFHWEILMVWKFFMGKWICFTMFVIFLQCLALSVPVLTQV